MSNDHDSADTPAGANNIIPATDVVIPPATGPSETLPTGLPGAGPHPPADPFATRQTVSTSPAPSAPAEELPSIPGYRIEGVLGRGGMGVVYKARQLALDRPVASR